MKIRFFVLIGFWLTFTLAFAQEATDFEANTIDNEKIKLSSLKGKVVVLNFWFKRCKPCREEIPDLHLLTQKYKDREVVFIALSLDSEKEVKEFLSENEFAYKHIANARYIANKWNIKGYPTNVVIDRNGKIIFSVSGLEVVPDANGTYKPLTPQNIDKKIEKALQR
jgi:peroxiredoxin